MIATLVAVSIVIFSAVRLLPGNVIDIMFGGDATATPEAKAAAAHQLGLDGSYPSQYWRWISGIFHGNLGVSLLNSRPISDTMKTALPITIELIFLGLLIAVTIGIPLGVISAVKRGSASDYLRARRRPDRHQHPGLLARDAAADLLLARLPLGAAALVRLVLRGPGARTCRSSSCRRSRSRSSRWRS